MNAIDAKLFKDLRLRMLTVADKDTAHEDWQETYQLGTLLGHCGCVSFIVQAMFGGEVLGARKHLWNRLPNGTEVDLTREDLTPQFRGRPVPPRKTTNPRYLVFQGRLN